MAKIFEDGALKLFLPFFVIESISKSTPSYDLALAFLIGFLLPLLALVGMWLYKMLASKRRFFTPHYDDLRFLASTYGGGNRGTVLFVLLFANSHNFSSYLQWFSLVDLGNFACLLLVISTLLARQYGIPPGKNYGVLSRVFDNYAVVTVFVVALYFSLRHFWPSIELLLSETIHARKFFFCVLVFLAITLRFEHGVLRNFFPDLLAFFSARLFTGICATVLLSPFLPGALPITLSVAILTMMPPSSFLPSMIGQSNAPKETVGFFNGFTGAANILYLGLVVIGFVVAISQALEPSSTQ
ncbi:MAG: hypothetical protein IPH26_18625 [Sterolibacteriaceae bacterium]|uniref:Uncharacterized protein n=1 Tax=Candidatus Methylophosphatis roskildensis TaxID=2899263 RepID=A0A9D7E1Q3_9PROT|nr:hypothetical protein [Candidatus Methylophosphatis roskildensis]MBK7237473.1 hypothetical protein [Sterolibacteriaceae bacterium]